MHFCHETAPAHWCPATVKREDGPLAEPSAALDLQAADSVYSADGTTNLHRRTTVTITKGKP